MSAHTSQTHVKCLSLLFSLCLSLACTPLSLLCPLCTLSFSLFLTVSLLPSPTLFPSPLFSLSLPFISSLSSPLSSSLLHPFLFICIGVVHDVRSISNCFFNDQFEHRLEPTTVILVAASLEGLVAARSRHAVDRRWRPAHKGPAPRGLLQRF